MRIPGDTFWLRVAKMQRTGISAGPSKPQFAYWLLF